MFFVASIAVLDVTSSKAVVGSPRYPPEYIILEFFGFSLFEQKVFRKTLQSLATCLSVSINLCQKLVLLIELQSCLKMTLKLLL